MRALVVYCHPRQGSFNEAVLEVVRDRLEAAGAEYEVLDLYRRVFSPVLTSEEHAGYLDCPQNVAPVSDDVALVRWADTLIFVYPTWWYGLPALLKGWLDRVLLPDVAFKMPDDTSPNIRPGLLHIERLAVFTTCGASWWLTQLVGAPGKRTLMRGLGYVCSRRLKRTYAAHYLMDSSTPDSRARHLDRVSRKMDQFIGRPSSTRREAPA